MFKNRFLSMTAICVSLTCIHSTYAGQAHIVIENMTSVQLGHASVASVQVGNTIYGLLPDDHKTIAVPSNTPVLIKLISLTYDQQWMEVNRFSDCIHTAILPNNGALNMYMVGKVPDGTIECRYY